MTDIVRVLPAVVLRLIDLDVRAIEQDMPLADMLAELEKLRADVDALCTKDD